MILKKILPGFAAILLLSFLVTSCLNDDNLIPPNCNDGILNNGEFDVDCGGPNCDPCPPSCTNGLWDVDFGETDVDCGGPNCDPCPTCNDGILNQDETGIDCGGEECEPCSTSGSCINGVLDGDETGVDCGGVDCPDCPEETCFDGIMNQDETGVDCGGANCPGCPEPTCDDGILNGLETGIDCGDITEFCPPCQLANQGQIIFRANNGDFDIFGGSTAIRDTIQMIPVPIITLTISGSAGSGESINMIIPNSQNINPGQTIEFNAATAAQGYVIGIEYGIFGNYLTATANSNISVTFDEISTEFPGTPVTGTISGTIFNFTESFSLTLTEGTFDLVATGDE
ncbi:MAG: hypothetical protein AB8B53_08955 [Flavobacteriales bacterium]